MNPSTKRTLSILLALFLFAASIFIYVSLIKPAYFEITGLRAKTAGLEQTLNNYASLSKDFQSLFAEYQNLGDLENQLKMVLPQKLSPDYIVNQITGLAKNSGLSLKSLSFKELSIKPSSVGLAKGLGTLRIDAKFFGNYEALKLFVKNLESNVMISDIVNLGISSGGGNEFFYNLLIDTYYQS